MSVHHEILDIDTKAKVGTTDITSRVRAAVTHAKVTDGICVVAVLHTTAGVFVNENADPNVQRDLISHLGKLVPRDEEFRHEEGNSDAHIKAVLTGNDVTLPVRDGELVLGTWAGDLLRGLRRTPAAARDRYCHRPLAVVPSPSR